MHRRLLWQIVNVPGASEVFTEGFITYSNQSKIKYLGVNTDTLADYGAVSEQTAKEMAIGAVKASGSNVSIAVTGIAGPGGGTASKLLVWYILHAAYLIKYL